MKTYNNSLNWFFVGIDSQGDYNLASATPDMASLSSDRVGVALNPSNLVAVHLDRLHQRHPWYMRLAQEVEPIICPRVVRDLHHHTLLFNKRAHTAPTIKGVELQTSGIVELPTHSTRNLLWLEEPQDRVPDLPAWVDAPDESWKDLLTITSNGNLHATAANVLAILRNDPALINALAYDEFGRSFMWVTDAPFEECATADRPLRGSTLVVTDLEYILNWVRKTYHVSLNILEFNELKRSFEPIITNKVNTLLNHIGCLPVWDGIPRLHNWMIRLYGAQNSDYTRRVGAFWLKSLMARAINPGCQVDYAIVLVGDELDLLKQSLGVLASERFALLDPYDIEGHTVNTVHRLRGKWLVNANPNVITLGHKNHIRRPGGRSALRSWLMARSDSFPASKRQLKNQSGPERPIVPDARRVSALQIPRSFVCAMVIDKLSRIDDVHITNTLIWPVECPHVNIEGLKAERPQLLAEAFRLVSSTGANTWIPSQDEVWPLTLAWASQRTGIPPEK